MLMHWWRCTYIQTRVLGHDEHGLLVIQRDETTRIWWEAIVHVMLIIRYTIQWWRCTYITHAHTHRYNTQIFDDEKIPSENLDLEKKITKKSTDIRLIKNTQIKFGLIKKKFTKKSCIDIHICERKKMSSFERAFSLRNSLFPPPPLHPPLPFLSLLPGGWGGVQPPRKFWVSQSGLDTI